MRRSLARLLAAVSFAAALAPVAIVPGAWAQQGSAPHAWLFGVWTGGLFPAASNVSAAVCLAQPTVIFTRDVVMRATLTEVAYDQRIVETARTTGGITEFQFSPAQDPVAATGNGLLGMQPPRAAAGFGCASPDLLRVQRHTDNEIVFPGCTDFPNPLVRCPSR
jgi:hypothetical protein